MQNTRAPPLEATLRQFEKPVLVGEDQQRNYCSVHGKRVLIGYHSHSLDYGEEQIGTLIGTGTEKFLSLQDSTEREREVIDMVLPQVLKCLRTEHTIIGIIRDSEFPSKRQ